MGMGRNFFIPLFLTLSQNRVSLLCSLTLFCLDKIIFPSLVSSSLVKLEMYSDSSPDGECSLPIEITISMRITLLEVERAKFKRENYIT